MKLVDCGLVAKRTQVVSQEFRLVLRGKPRSRINLPVAEISKDSAHFNDITPNAAVRLMLGALPSFLFGAGLRRFRRSLLPERCF